jgi:MarR family transcriptional regulator, organic hydroperoxide resistance regulator
MTVKAETGTSSVSREIWELLLELSMSRVRARFLNTITDLGLSFPQAHALKVLRPGHPIAMRELADGLHCDPSNITGIVDRLGDRGLVERGAAPGDRRVKTLMLTEEGTALRMRLLDRLSEPPPGLGKLSVGEQRLLCDLLRRALLD